MGKQSRFPQHELAHRFQILQSRVVPKPAQRCAHLGKGQLRLVAEAEKSFGASQLLARTNDREHLIRSHGVRARIVRISAEDTVAAVIAAEIGERDENFSRISDGLGLEPLFGSNGGSQQFR